jgi:hypothetical protein
MAPNLHTSEVFAGFSGRTASRRLDGPGIESLASVRQCHPAETTGIWTVTGSA